MLDDALRRPPAADTRTGSRWIVRNRAPVLAAAAFFALPLFLAAHWWRGSRDHEQFHAVPLTSLSGAVTSPSLSPDGNNVVFSWNGPKQDNTDLYIQQIGAGAPRRLTTDPNGDYHPAWSPDGRAIAFLRSGLAGGKNEVPRERGPERRRTQTRRYHAGPVVRRARLALVVPGLDMRARHRFNRPRQV